MSTNRFRGRNKPSRTKLPARCSQLRDNSREPGTERPLRVRRHGRDAETGRCWVQLSVVKLDGKRRTVLVPREQATRPNELRAQLASMGAILPARAIADLCQEILEHQVAELVKVASRAGWVGRRFVLDGKVIAGTKGLLVVPPEERLPPGPAVAGSLAAWSRGVAGPARHSSRLMLAITLAFSGPLLHVAKGRNGVFNLSGRSTSGKSSALLVGNAVFRSGQRSRLLTWDVTTTGLQELASEHCDSLLCLDETQRKSLNRGEASKAVLEAAFDLESGVGRVVTKVYRNKPRMWRINVLSSSEYRMFANGSNQLNGGHVRLFDIPAVVHATHGIFETLPEGVADSRTLMQSIEAASEANFGHAGREFVTKLLRDRTVWLKKIDRWRDSFLKTVGDVNADWDARFTARFAAPFGLAYAAGRTAIAMGIVPWRSDHLRKAIESCCRDAAIGAAAPTLHTTAAMATVRNKLSNRKIVLDLRDGTEMDASKLRKACGFIVRRDGLSMYAIKPKAFVRWCGGEAMAAAFLNQLRQAGRLVASGNKQTPYKQVQIPGVAQRRRYVCLRHPLVVALASAA